MIRRYVARCNSRADCGERGRSALSIPQWGQRLAVGHRRATSGGLRTRAVEYIDPADGPVFGDVSLGDQPF